MAAWLICKQKFVRAQGTLPMYFFEISCQGSSFALKYGGVEADAEVVRQGYIAHMRTAKENRWCVPESIVNLDAVWICTTSFENVTGMDFHLASLA